MVHTTALFLFVFHSDLLTLHQRIADQFIGIQIGTMKFYAGNLAVFIGGVIVNALCGIAAAGIYGLFVEIANLHTALLLGNRTENVKDLADAGRFIVLRNGVEPCKSGFYKSGSRRQISRQTQSAHSAAVGL